MWRRTPIAWLICFMGLLSAQALATPIPLDDFEDGTVENWIVGPLGAAHPAPPANVPTGGPGGADDNFMLLTAIGGGGAGSRLTVMNGSQWAGDYIAGGVTFIEMDVNNLGTSELSLRLLFEDPLGGPPTNLAISDDPVLVPSGSGWIHVTFPVTAADLLALLGTASGALSHTTFLRIFHNPVDGFPPPPISASLGVDNITANAAPAAVPEPSALMMLVSGAAALLARRRHRHTRARRPVL